MVGGQKESDHLTREQIAAYDREGYLVLPNFLSSTDLEPVRLAMQHKVSQIADELYANGLVTSKYEDSPFDLRLARLFENLQDSHFLKFGRSWRERKPG